MSLNGSPKDQLIALAELRLGYVLSSGERRVVEDSVSLAEPPSPAPRDAKFPVRAEFLRWLGTDAGAASFIGHSGIRVFAAWFEGQLDLSSCRCPHRLDFDCCEFAEQALFGSAELVSLYLSNCLFRRGLNASRLTLHGPLVTNNALEGCGTFSFSGIRVADEVDFKGLKLFGMQSHLDLYNARIGGDLILQGVRVEGRVSVVNAKVAGNFICSGELCDAQPDPSDELSVCAAKQEDSALPSADKAKAATQVDPDKAALDMMLAEIAGLVNLSGLRWKGLLRAGYAKVGNSFFLNDAEQSTSSPLALDLSGLDVKNSVDLSRTIFRGKVEMFAGSIGNQLRCLGTRLEGGAGEGNEGAGASDSSSSALSLTSVHIVGDVLLTNDNVTPNEPVKLFEASGAFEFLRCQCEGSVRIYGARLLDHKVALDLSGSVVQGDLRLGVPDVPSSCYLKGAAILSGIRVKGDLDCINANVGLVQCRGMRVEGDMVWRGVVDRFRAELYLDYASVGTLHDERESWPSAGKLGLIDFGYKKLQLHSKRAAARDEDGSEGEDKPLRPGDRRDWLDLQRPTNLSDPQPWLQLASTLRANGDEGGARWAIFWQRRRQAAERSPVTRPISWFWHHLVREPWLILISLAVCLALGTFTFAQYSAEMAPTRASVAGKPEPGQPKFSPFFYTLENNLPLVKLGLDDKWAPGLGAAHSFLLTAMRRFLILWGWFQATVLASAVGAKFRG